MPGGAPTRKITAKPYIQEQDKDLFPKVDMDKIERDRKALK